MADSDFDFIKPVESLHNVQGLTPAKERQERRRRQRAPAEAPQPPEHNKQGSEETPDEGEAHAIDYCA